MIFWDKKNIRGIVAMKRTFFAVAALLTVTAATFAGCGYLPPLPLPTLPVDTSIPTTVPPSLTQAANRIFPSVVIVDTPSATGTGWIFDKSGIIVTNYHVIEGARTVVVTLHDGRRLNVQSIASDPVGDLAVLRVNASNLTAATTGSSASLKVGDPVVAVGNSLGEGISVKTGQITHLDVTVGIENEQYYGLIEDNAPIQEGDSGGPLVNNNGEVIGISNAKVIGLEDIAYAISIDSAMPLLQQLITKGSVDRAYLGIYGLDNPNGNGVLLQQVSPGGPADQAGLRAGDIILAIDGKAVTSMDALTQTIRSLQVGQRVTITYRRGSTQSDVSVTLIQRPA